MKQGFLKGDFTMIKVYGVIKKQGFCIGDTESKTLIGTYTRESAYKIMMDDGFINRWNDNHIANIYKLIFETEED